MNEGDGLICAFILDGKGGGDALDWSGIRSWTESKGVLWVHLDFMGAETKRWLIKESGIDPVICDALLQEDARPRLLPSEDAFLIVLRGVNLNPGANPEDMVGLRIWIDGKRIITLRHRRLLAINDIREQLAANCGPKGPGQFLVAAANGLIDRMGPVVEDLDDEIDALEDRVLSAHSSDLRSELADVRRQSISLRRYLAPQRDVLSRLSVVAATWLDDRQKAYLREVADRTIRYLEDLEAGRERAAVTQEELNSRLSDQMNKTMYVLTVVAAVLLPPSLITGLFGINVGGMPWVESNLGFVLIVSSLFVVGIVEVVVFRRLKWI